MAGKVILRAFLVLALIVTAHLIRPFSIKNVTQHALYSARSFRFALPDQMREKFDHANYLAVNLSNSLFEADEGIRDFTRVMTANLGSRPIDVQPLEEVNKSATKQKPAPKKSAPAKRINRTEKKSVIDSPFTSSLVAVAHSNEIRLIELSLARHIQASGAVSTPPCPTKTSPTPAGIKTDAPIRLIETALMPRKRDCEKREADQRTRGSVGEDETEAKSAIWVVEKSGLRKITIRIPEPEEQKVEAPADEVETEFMRVEPASPRDPEEQKSTSSLSLSPFAKCSKDPR